ncbi:DUF5667 domain-containing protein [Nocardioides limicola]|uniref:DUF5667 domain-containing protein n=1 Tax=Nocardioides limicola TaxID=2803368 RepID=UPI00193C0B5F|nr:DUF5667 domain-containing protein [Nocardioides sp. DJM-14]
MRPTRRRAEEFARLVDAPASRLTDSEYADLIRFVGELRSVPTPTPDPAFVGQLRSDLLEVADNALRSHSPTAMEQKLSLPRNTPSLRPQVRLAVGAGALALIGASTSMAVASQSALPGDALYPIKRAMESAQAGVALSDTGKGTQYLSAASSRLDEVESLAQQRDAKIPAIDATLASFDDQALTGGDLLLTSEGAGVADAQAVRDFAAASMQRLGQLSVMVPSSNTDSLLNSARVVADLDERAATACPACTGGVTEIPQLLLLLAGQSPTDTLTPPGVLVAVPILPSTPGEVELPDLSAPITEPASPTEVDPEAVVEAEAPVAETPKAPGKVRTRLDKVLDRLDGDDPDATSVSDVLAPIVDPVADLLDGTINIVGNTVGGLLGD